MNQKFNLFSNLPKESKILEALSFREDWVEVQMLPTERPKDVKTFVEQFNANWKQKNLNFHIGLMEGRTRGKTNHYLENLWSEFQTNQRIKDMSLKLKHYCTEVNDDDETGFEVTPTSSLSISANRARIMVGFIAKPERGNEFTVIRDRLLGTNLGKFKFSYFYDFHKIFFSETTTYYFCHVQQRRRRDR